MQAENFLIVDIQGTELTTEDIAVLSHSKVLGLILFSRNFANLEQLRQLIADIRSKVRKNLLITVDQEGGRVQRFREGFTQLPAMQAFTLLDKSEQESWTRECGWQMASEMLALDIDLSFAPVLDLGHQCLAIGDRSFGENKEQVLFLAQAFIGGMAEAGMSAVGKHFPGHGSVQTDSHYETPTDNRSKSEISQQDMAVFADLISQNKLQGIMPAHVIYPAFNPMPACGSKYWLKEILRTKLGFEGAVFSDDLNMGGADILGDYSQRIAQAFNAGCDVALLCNNRPAVLQVLVECKVKETDTQRVNRVEKLFPHQAKISWQALQQSPRYQRNLEFLGTLQRQWLAVKAGSVTDPTKYTK